MRKRLTFGLASSAFAVAAMGGIVQAHQGGVPNDNACPANGALIAASAKVPGANAGPDGPSWNVAPGTPSSPGQSIKDGGKSSPVCLD